MNTAIAPWDPINERRVNLSFQCRYMVDQLLPVLMQAKLAGAYSVRDYNEKHLR